MSIKVAFIGAGSVGFTRCLFRDILSVPELQDTHFAFTDINKRNLDMITQLCEKDLRNNKLPAKITATLDRRKALADADYVVNVVRIGGLEAFQMDIDIPLKYGIDQCVGDTLCAGGIMYGQRNIPAVLDFCKDIREVAKPEVLFLNYANPNVMNTWAANEYGKVNTIGLCHGVMGGHEQITEVIRLLVNGNKKAGDRGYVEVTLKDVDIICAGITSTWYIRFSTRPKTGPADCWKDLKNIPSIVKRKKYGSICFDASDITAPNPTAIFRNMCPGIANARKKSNAGSIFHRGLTVRPADICASAPKIETGSRPIFRPGLRWKTNPSGRIAAMNTAVTLSKPWRREGCTADILMFPTKTVSPICPTIVLLRFQATSIEME